MKKVRWTFNLPDFQDRVIQGIGTRGNVGTYKTESLPNITGWAQFYGQILLSADGCMTRTVLGTSSDPAYNLSNTFKKLNFDASYSSSTYQNNAPVQPNALLIQCCIKY